MVTKRIKISDVKIQKCFEDSIPRLKKIAEAVAYIMVNGDVDKPITIDEDNILIDGYIRYLAALRLGTLEDLPYIRSHKNTFTFIQARMANETAYKSDMKTLFRKDDEWISEKKYIDNEIKSAIEHGKGCICLPNAISQKSYSLLKSAGYKVCYIMDPFVKNEIKIYTSIDWSDADDWREK